MLCFKTSLKFHWQSVIHTGNQLAILVARVLYITCTKYSVLTCFTVLITLSLTLWLRDFITMTWFLIIWRLFLTTTQWVYCLLNLLDQASSGKKYYIHTILTVQSLTNVLILIYEVTYPYAQKVCCCFFWKKLD